MSGGINPANIINGAIHTVTDLAQGKIADAGKDLLGTAAQAAPLAAALLPGGGIVSGLLGSALGGAATGGIGGIASSILGAASGLPSIASGLTSSGGLQNILQQLLSQQKAASGSSGTSGQGTLDGSSLDQLTQQLKSDLDFQKQADAITTAFKRASTIEGLKLDLALGALGKIHA